MHFPKIKDGPEPSMLCRPKVQTELKSRFKLLIVVILEWLFPGGPNIRLGVA